MHIFFYASALYGSDSMAVATATAMPSLLRVRMYIRGKEKSCGEDGVSTGFESESGGGCHSDSLRQMTSVTAPLFAISLH